MHIMINTLTLNRGGTERVITNLCNEYLVAKHTITIVTSVCAEPKYEINNKIKIISLDNSIKQIKQNKVIRFVRRRKRLKKIIENVDPDIILSFLPEPNFLILSLKKIFKIPIIISVRNDPKSEYSFIIHKLLMKVLYPLSDGFVFQTKDAKEYFKFSSKIYNKSIIIPNPINPEFICEPYKGIRSKEIVSVGRFDSQKNHKLLIDAFSKVSREFPEYKLVLYGDGELRDDLQNQIDQLKITNNVKLPGVQTNISKLIYKTSLFVLTSNYEGMPNALMEAMALGLPVISTDCPAGGPKSLIDNEVNGILTEVGNVVELESSMMRVLNDKKFAHKLSDNARKISFKYEPMKIYSEWGIYIENIFDSMEKVQ